MAKDIDLVVRARNEASKALEDVTKSLGALSAESGKVTKDSNTLGGALGALKGKVQELGKQNDAIAAFTKLVGAMDKGTAAASSIEANLARLTSELQAHKREADQAAFATDRLKSAQAALTQIDEREKVAIAATTETLKAQTKEVDRLASALSRLEKAKTDEKGAASRQTSVDKATTRFQGDHTNIQKTTSEIAALQKQLKSVEGVALSDVEKRVLAAVKNAVPSGQILTVFSNVRKQIADLSRDVQDDAFKSLYQKKFINFSEYSDPKRIKPEVKEAALTQLGVASHIVTPMPNAPAIASGPSPAEQASIQAKIAQLQAQKDKQTEALARSQAALEKAEKRIEDAEKKVAEREASKATLQAQLAAAKERQAGTQATLTGQQAVNTQTAAGVGDYGAKVKEANSLTRTLQESADKTAASVIRETETLGRAKGALAEIAASAQAASAGMGGLAPNVDSATAALARNAAQSAQAKARLDALSAAPKAAPVATGTDRESLNARRAVNVEFIQAREEVNALAAAMRAADNPTEELAAAFGRAQARVTLASAALKEQKAALAEVTAAQSSFLAMSEKQGKTTRDYGPAPMAKPTQTPVNLGPSANADTKKAGADAGGAAPAIRALDDGFKGLNDTMGQTSGKVREVGDGTRQTLSLHERLRGEVIGLAASYVGLQAAMTGAAKVIETFKTMEAVQNRLGSVFNQDTARVGVEVDFLQRQAGRLGISFGALAGEYGKLAIAAKAQNFESEETRRIFLSVAEAGRVNKLSTDDMSRVFLALTQMMSKGKVMSQELKTQMSEVLPGAYEIFARALGKTTVQLEDMLAKGEVFANSDTMMAFANELNKRFGPQLQDSLKSTTTEIGRFQNGLEQAALQVASGGFIVGFTNLLKTMNEYFASKEGREFFLGLGAAAGSFFNALSAVVPYMGTLVKAAELFVAVKLGQSITGLVTSFMAWRAGLAATRAELAGNAASVGVYSGAQGQLNASTATLVGSLTRLQVVLEMNGVAGGVAGAGYRVAAAGAGLLRTALSLASTAATGLLAAFGGIAGIAITGLTVALGYWLTTTDSATSAMADHKVILDAVVQKYDEAKDKTKDWANEIKGASRAQVEAKLREAEANLATQKRGVQDPTVDLGGGINVALNNDLTAVIMKYQQGKTSAAEYKKALDDLGQAKPDLKAVIVGLQNQADELIRSEDGVDKLRAAWDLMMGRATPAQRALLGTGDALKSMGTKEATVDLAKFTEAVEALKSKLPGLAIEMQRVKAEKDAFSNYENAVRAAGDNSVLQLLAKDAYDKASKVALDDESKAYLKQLAGDKVPLSLFNLIYAKEDKRNEAYQNKNDVPTIGYGSTRVDGVPVKMGDTITDKKALEQATNDLVKFSAMVDAAIGEAKLNENQRNALVSYVYNVGNTGSGSGANAKTKAIFDAIREGATDTAVAELIANGVATSGGGIPNPGLASRRKEEARLYLKPVDALSGESTGPTQADIAAKKAADTEKLRKQSEDQARKLTNDASDQTKINDSDTEAKTKREVALAKNLRDERQKYKDAGVEIGAQQEQEIANLQKAFTLQYDAVHVADQAKEQEAKALALVAERKALQEQLKVAKEQGDGGKIEETRQAIIEVNKKTQEAIDLAIKYWQEVGGPEADKAIAKLKQKANESERAEKGILTAGRANDMLASGLTSAFDRAASGIGRAIAGTEKWGDAIKGVGMAFMQFAADFLREIALMILKALILKAIQSAMGMPGGAGGSVASIANALVGSGHTGGVVGSRAIGGGNAMRSVNPAIFANAARFHEGGIPGLKPGEVPAILQEGEEVMTKNDPRHAMNGGKGGRGSGPKSIKSVLVMDPEILNEHLQSEAGEQIVLGHLKKNKSTVRNMLE